MELQWSKQAWEEYVGWQKEDKKTLNKINSLVKSIQREGKPKGKAEILKGSKHGLCSVRIDEKNRLIYKVDGDILRIVSCKGHYEK